MDDLAASVDFLNELLANSGNTGCRVTAVDDGRAWVVDDGEWREIEHGKRFWLSHPLADKLSFIHAFDQHPELALVSLSVGRDSISLTLALRKNKLPFEAPAVQMTRREIEMFTEARELEQRTDSVDAARRAEWNEMVRLFFPGPK